MKAAPYDYAKPHACDEAIALVAATDGMGKFVSGSQSLGPMMNLRLAQPDMLVDLRGIAALRACRIDGEVVTLGAAVTHAEIEDGKHLVLRDGPLGSMLRYVAAGIAYRAVRNRGTIGGSLAHADPAADWPLALSALDAQIELTGATGVRQVPAAQFMLGAFTTQLADGELITAVVIPQASDAMRWGYYKLCRKTGEFAHASAAAVFDAGRGYARVVVGALEGPAASLDALAASIAQRGAAAATQVAIADAVAAVMPNADAIDRGMHEAAVERCVAAALDPSTI